MKILDYVDAVVLVVVIAASVWAIATGAGMKKEETGDALGRADAAIAELEAAMSRDTYAETEGAAILDHLATLPPAVERQWNPPPVEADFPEGIFYHPDSLADLRDGRDLELRFPAPTDLTATARLEGIRIAFAPNERSTVFITGYRIYRTDDDGDERLVAEIDGTSWLDRDVLAGHLYSYRVAAVTDEEILVKRGKEESPKTQAVSVRGQRDYEIVPDSWDEETQTMRVLVRKHHDGVWHEKLFDAEKGEIIGELDPGSGVDYSTACRVERFEIREETVTETRDEVGFDLEGRVILSDNGEPITTRRTYNRPRKVVVLVFRNELGQIERIEHRP